MRNEFWSTDGEWIWLDMLGFQLIFAQGVILECPDSCKCVYQIQEKGQVKDNCPGDWFYHRICT